MNSNSVQLVPSRAVNTGIIFQIFRTVLLNVRKDDTVLRYGTGTARCAQGRYGTAQCAQGRLVSSRGSRLQKRAALTAHISSS